MTDAKTMLNPDQRRRVAEEVDGIHVYAVTKTDVHVIGERYNLFDPECNNDQYRQLLEFIAKQYKLGSEMHGHPRDTTPQDCLTAIATGDVNELEKIAHSLIGGEG